MFYPVSNDLRRAMDDAARQTVQLTITLADSTVLNIDDEDIMTNGLVIDRYSMNGERLELGNVSAHQLSVNLINKPQFDEIDFDGGEIKASCTIAGETINLGTYYITESEVGVSIIRLTALDYLCKLDIKWNFSGISFPISVQNLVSGIATACGITITLGDGKVNEDQNITANPGVDCSYRVVLGWCASLMGYNQVLVDFLQPTPTLKMVRYSTADDRFDITNDHRYSSSVASQDAVITGVVCNDGINNLLSGTDDYAIDVSDNPLVSRCYSPSTIVSNLAGAWTGFAYRPFSATTLAYPMLMPMDSVNFTDRYGVTHYGIVSHVHYVQNGAMQLKGRGLAPQSAEQQISPQTTSAQQQTVVIKSLEGQYRTSGVFIGDNDIKVETRAVAGTYVGIGQLRVWLLGLDVFNANSYGVCTMGNAPWQLDNNVKILPFTDTSASHDNIVSLTDLKNLGIIRQFTFFDTLTLGSLTSQYDITFASNGEIFDGMDFQTSGMVNYRRGDGTWQSAYWGGAWGVAACKNITIINIPHDVTFYDWLMANGTTS